MRQFKYKQTFATRQIRIVFPEEKSVKLAMASLESLKGVLPLNINPQDNPDLLLNSFNALVVNRINLNDDGISTATGLKLAKNFLHKYCDIEHDRNRVVGSIVNTGFSEFLTNRILTEEEVANRTDPFNVVLASAVWPVVDPTFAELLIESSDETSPLYQQISASWEIGFDEINIALGSRDLAQAEIITDSAKVIELEKYLKANGSEGKTPDGVPVYRIMVGDVFPLGIAYTTTPAADVRGVLVPDQQTLEPQLEQDNQVTEAEIIEKNNSQEFTQAVNSYSIMKVIKTVDDLTDDVLKEASASVVKDLVREEISNGIQKASDDFAKKLEEANEAKATQEKTAEDLKRQLDEQVQSLAQVKQELETEKTTRMQEKALSDFNVRMASLDSEYNLNDKDRAILAKQIRGLSDVDYSEWLSSFSVLAEAKKKSTEDTKDGGKDDSTEAPTSSNPDPDNDGDDDRYSKTDTDNSHWNKDGTKKMGKWGKASQASVENTLNNITPDPEATPPNTSSGTQSLKELFADEFKVEDFHITTKANRK